MATNGTPAVLTMRFQQPRLWLSLAALWVLIVNSALFVLYWWPSPKRLRGDEQTYVNAAQDLVEGGALVVDSMWPPGQAWIVAAVDGSLPLVQFIQFIFLLGVAWLASRLCRQWCQDSLAATIVAIVLLAYPPFAAYAQYLWPEMAHLFFLLLSWLLLVRDGEDHAPLSMLGTFCAGLSLGAALLIKSVGLLFLPLLLFLLPRGQLLKSASVFVLGVMLVLVPISAIKYEETGHWSLHTSGPFNLWVGLNDVSRQGHVRPIAGRESAKFYRSADSMQQRNVIYLNKSIELIDQAGPVSTLMEQLIKQPFRLFDYESFFSTERGYALAQSPWARGLVHYSSAFYVVLMLGAWYGMLSWPRRRRGWWVPFAFVAYVCGLLLLLHAKARFRIVFVPCLAMFFAWSLSRWLQVGIRQSWYDLGRVRQITFLAGAPIVLIFTLGAAWLDRHYPIS